MRMISIVILGMMLSLACSAPAKTSWDIEPMISATVCINVDADHVADVESAIAAWDVALGSFVLRSELREGEWDGCNITINEVDRADGTCEINAGGCADGNRTLGINGGSAVYLVKGRYTKDVRGITMHELGHALGAGHIQGTLMDPKWHSGLGNMECPDTQSAHMVADALNLSDVTPCE